MVVECIGKRGNHSGKDGPDKDVDLSSQIEAEMMQWSSESDDATSSVSSAAAGVGAPAHTDSGEAGGPPDESDCSPERDHSESSEEILSDETSMFCFMRCL